MCSDSLNRTSSIPTQHDGERVTEVEPQIPSVRTAKGHLYKMYLLLRGGYVTGTLTSIRIGNRPGVYYVQTADRPDEYAVKIDPVMAGKITQALMQNDTYGQRLGDSLRRQQKEARRRIGSTE